MSSGSASRIRAASSAACRRTSVAAFWTALPDTTAVRLANVPTPQPSRRVSPVVTRTCSIGTPSSSAAIWAKIVWWPWPWVARPVATVTVPSTWTLTAAPS